MRITAFLLVFALVLTPVFAQTTEVTSDKDYWQEFDMTFWQTLPFAIFWTHVLDVQFSNYILKTTEPHWGVVSLLAVGLSALNASFNANQVMKNERTGYSH